MLFTSFLRLPDIINLRSPYPEAVEQVKEYAQNYTVVTTPYTLYQYYGKKRMINFGSIVRDDLPVIYAADWASLVNPAELALQEGRAPIFEIPSNIGRNYFILRDLLQFSSREEVRDFIDGEDLRLTSVRFYDLGQNYPYMSRE